MINLFLALLLICLQVGDGFTTYKAIDTGKGKEANPALIWLESKLPGKWTWLIAVKSLVATAAGVLAISPSLVVSGILLLAIIVYSWIVWHNWQIIK